MQVEGPAAEGHQQAPRGVEQGAPQYDPAGAVAVGDYAQEGQAKEQVLQRHRQTEHFASQSQILTDRLQEEPERLADAHAEQDRQGAESTIILVW